ncbi:MoaD/ThiS family protein [Sulfurospirillum sp. 1612]|uniref:MoaD/ThiS family protein n=1 Tax=Sulfurospirillum sp. 1612 TaxID=3094835 RepID=UPI002F93DD5F
MIHITFNAFSFLREKLKAQGIPYVNAPMELPKGITPNQIIKNLNFKDEEVEAVFINGVVLPKDTILKEGDRLALLPPGTPGSYRLMLGIKQEEGDF